VYLNWTDPAYWRRIASHAAGTRNSTAAMLRINAPCAINSPGPVEFDQRNSDPAKRALEPGRGRAEARAQQSHHTRPESGTATSARISSRAFSVTPATAATSKQIAQPATCARNVASVRSGQRDCSRWRGPYAKDRELTV